MKQIILFAMISITLVGCGSGSSDSPSEPIEETEDVNMTKNIIYTVFPNNKIIKNSPDTLVKISHKDNTNHSTVMLLSGSATILRKP